MRKIVIATLVVTTALVVASLIGAERYGDQPGSVRELLRVLWLLVTVGW